MRRALSAANEATRCGGSPIGCVIVLNGEVVATAYNEVERMGDPTAHAEILAIRHACAVIGLPELRGATLYSTLQPCGMCTMAAIWAKIGRIVYGAGRENVHRMYFEDRHYDCADFAGDAFRTDLEVRGGVFVEACAALYPDPEENIPAADQANL